MSIIKDIASVVKNLVLNAAGVERTFLQYIDDGDINNALKLMTSNEDEVMQALKEYDPESHAVMSRRNKMRSGRNPYETCKLPRTRQNYINEVELFFLLGNDIVWTKEDGDDEAYKLFTEFIKSTRFASNMRKVKRIAGSETECAKYYRLYRDTNGEAKYDVIILSKSKGYDLRTLIDQYGHLVAAAYGFKTKRANGKTIDNWVFLTPDATFECTKGSLGWEVTTSLNPTHRINLVYYKQPKAWGGVQHRCDREEDIDSKIGDTNNYFADPIAKATADVLQAIADPDTPGKVIQLQGRESSFDYVNPPQASELRRDEQLNLSQSILFDSFTPDFSFENMKGMGTLTGESIKRALILGYIKRQNRMEIYEELVDRDLHVMLGVLAFLNPTLKEKIEALDISFAFAEPFGEDTREKWSDVANLYGAGLVSLEEAVRMVGVAADADAEIELIMGAENGTQKKIGFKE